MDKKNFFIPSMLTKFINCKHIISNEYFEKSHNLDFEKEENKKNLKKKRLYKKRKIK